ncbi:MAG: ABC transporter substrate-binding protein [Aeromicrobium sp.]
MKRSTKTIRFVAVAAASALVLAACSGSDSDDKKKADSLAKGDGFLMVGTLLPQTGDLAYLGPPDFAAVDLAVKDMNEAGGVLGKEAKQTKADSGEGSPDVAPGSVDKLLSAKSDVIVGAASSSVSLNVIDKIVSAGVVQFSPGATSTAFDTYDDKSLFFRTAPSDVMQGNVLGNLVFEDGAKNVAILARQDAYGKALANSAEKTIKDQGGTVGAKVFYRPDATTYKSEIAKLKDAKPDAVAVIALNETTKIIPGLEAAGIGPKDVKTYFVDGNTYDYSRIFPKGTLKGVKATYPGAELKDDFKSRLLAVNPHIKSFAFAGESYDAAIMSALAAEAAKNDSGEAIASELVKISRGGEKCTTYAACLALLKDAKDIDYNGVSGPVDLNKAGSPSKAIIGIYKYRDDNTYKNLDYVTGEVK